jgi:branched-chain amino acid transport system ATP-binding protein
MRLELRSVTVGYGATVAVREVDLVVPAGTVVALLGPNGAGKTTLLRAASGMLTPVSGRILLDGEDVTGLTRDQFACRGLCHITEGRSVFPGLTVKENLRMFTAPATEALGIERALQAFPVLRDRLGQIAGTMSGGQQQMLALARAYARKAPLVLLDEVSMGLAPIVVDEIFKFLEHLRSDGASLLLVEQYASRALALATHVYVLNQGRIAFRGEPGELRHSDLLAHYLGASAPS